MLANHVLVALRALRKRPGFTAINVAGLAVGLGCALLIALFVRYDLTFDRFAPHAERTYRLVTEVAPPDAPPHLVDANGWPLGPAVEEAFPEVEALTSLRGPWNPDVRLDGRILQPTVLHADTRFLDVLGFPLVAGDAAAALAEPYTVVLTASLARTLFGEADPMGQSLWLSTDSTAYTVTGVAADPPARSHLQFDGLVSFASFGAGNPDFDPSDRWFSLQIRNYLRLRDGVDPDAFAAKLATVYDRHFGVQNGYALEAQLEPLTRVYLHSEAGNGLGPMGDADTLLLLGAIAGLILLIAAINFVNLATARAAERAREVGVRKVVGSSRAALVRQFLSESVLLTTLALGVGVALAVGTLPFFNDLADRDFTAADLAAPWAGALVLGLVLVVGLGAGLYPALALSGYRPARVLKGRFAAGPEGTRLRQGLVVLQFALSIGLVIATLSVLRQLDYMQTRALGFAADEVLVVEAGRVPGSVRHRHADAFAARVAGVAGVRTVALAGAGPGYPGWSGQMTFRAGHEASGLSMEHVMADAAYVGALGLPLVAGRDFDPDRASDQDGVLLNEEAVRALGWPTPEAALGETVVSPGSGIEGPVLGVLGAYHQHGLQQPIPPLAVSLQNARTRHLFLVRFAPGRRQAVEAEALAAWADLYPGYAPTTTLLADRFAEHYEAERRLARVFTVFAGLAVALACLGLLGLAAYAAAQRTKEIGVRKVLGASVVQLVALLSKDFVVLVVVAFTAAAPVAWWAMERWLGTFAYRTALGPGEFALAGLAALALALLTVAWQALRAATADPIQSLRYE